MFKFESKRKKNIKAHDLLEKLGQFDDLQLDGILEAFPKDKLAQVAVKYELNRRERRRNYINSLIIGTIPTLLGVALGFSLNYFFT